MQKIKKQFQQLEEKISGVTDEKNKLESDLSLPSIYTDNKKFVETENRYQQKSIELAKDNEEYEKLFEKILEMEEKMAEI